MKRLRLFFFIATQLGLSACGALAQTTQPDEFFSVEDLIKGSTITQDACAATPAAMWIEVAGRGDCIRYYASGLKDRNDVAIIYFAGDRLFGTADPTRYDADPEAQGKLTEIVRSGYLDNTAAANREQIRWIQSGLDIPVIKIARPGTYGSSGDHKERRQVREQLLMAAAVDRLKRQFNIGKIALTGNSGGGSIAASTMGKVDGVGCAVLTSSALSLQAILKVDGTSGYNSGPDVYDPIKHIGELARDPRRSIFVIGDPADVISPIDNQREYAEAAKAAGHQVWFVTTPTAAGGSHHTLDRTGLHVAKWCLEGVPATEIVKRIEAGALRG